MALSSETRAVIKAQIDALKLQKEPIVQSLKDATKIKQNLSDQKDALDARIQKLQTDLNNG